MVAVGGRKLGKPTSPRNDPVNRCYPPHVPLRLFESLLRKACQFPSADTLEGLQYCSEAAIRRTGTGMRASVQ